MLSNHMSMKQPSKHFLSSHPFLFPFFLIYSLCSCSVAQSCLTFCDPVDCSSPGFSVMGLPRQKYRAGCRFLLHGNLPDSGIQSTAPAFLLWRWVLHHCATLEAPSVCLSASEFSSLRKNIRWLAREIGISHSNKTLKGRR